MAVLALAAFGLSGGLGGAAASGAPTGSSEAYCQKANNLPSPICHVIVMFFENQLDYSVLQTKFQGGVLAKQYADAGRMYSVEHFSFPNYLAATAGYVTNFQHPMNQTNVVDLLKAHQPALSWDAYMGGMSTPCNETPNADYRTAHNPFGWYADIANNRSYCRSHDVNMSAFTTAVATNHVPVYSFISPNVTDDCWKLGVRSCDAWLSQWLPPLMNDSFWAHTALILTYDESILSDNSSVNGTVGGGHIYTSIVSPYSCKGFTSKVHYDQYDILTTTEWLLGLGRLGAGHQDNWTQDPPMSDMFCFPNGTAPPTLPVGLAHLTGGSSGGLASFLFARRQGVTFLDGETTTA